MEVMEVPNTVSRSGTRLSVLLYPPWHPLKLADRQPDMRIAIVSLCVLSPAWQRDAIRKSPDYDHEDLRSQSTLKPRGNLRLQRMRNTRWLQ